MKPAFALDFRNDAITLLHRNGAEWVSIGSVPVTAPDLTEAMAYLRATALGLSPRGISTKLIIPNDQILFTSVFAPGPDAASRLAQVRAALAGRTPYAVEDLAFDISGTGPDVQVAVIAKETLAEAEAFAADNRFNPMCFVAVPEPDHFIGEPFFAETALAASLLSAGDKVEGDYEPVSITTRSLAPEAEAEDEPAFEPEPEPELEPEPEPVAEVLAEDFAGVDLTGEDSAEAAFETAVEDEPAFAPDDNAPPLWDEPEAVQPAAFEEFVRPVDAVEAPAPIDDLPLFNAAPVPASPAPKLGLTIDPLVTRPAAALSILGVTPILEPVPADPSRDDLGFERTVRPPVEEDTAPDTEWTRVFEQTEAPEISAKDALQEADFSDDEAPMALDVPLDDEDDEEAFLPKVDAPETAGDALAAQTADLAADPKPASVLGVSIEDELPPAPSEAVTMAFASRRLPSETGLDADATAAPKLQGNTKDGAIVAKVARPAAATPLKAAPSKQSLATKAAAAKAAAKAGKGLRGFGALVTSQGIAGGREKSDARKIVPPIAARPTGLPASQPLAGSASAAAASLSPQSRKPVGLGGRPMPVGGKPRYLGITLTVLLLLFLAVVAAWSSYYIASLGDKADPVAVVEPVATPNANDTALADETSTVDEEMLADMQDPEALADAPLTDLAADELPLDAPIAEATLEPAPQTLVGSDADTTALPDVQTQDEIFLASMDAAPSPPDPLSLPQTADARGDPLPVAQAAPPPFGTVYQFDEDGLIRPTPEGIITPEGVLLIAGKPPRVPTPRPESVVAAAAALAAPAAALGPDGQAVVAGADTDALFSDPALAGKRPAPRPEGLVAPAANPDDASLAPEAGTRVASVRPLARPASVLAIGEAARLESQNASLAAQAQATAEAEAAALAAADAAAGTTSTSPMAVAISRKPEPRPRDLSRAVEAAVAAAAREPIPEVEEPPKKGKPVEEDDAEPEVASAAPKIPTKASVAKNATFKNAINLSNINLIGVYGTKNNRYALIRQANGRYKKVRVGDNIDGGKVAAITSDEVRYKKGGRIIALEMPRG